MFKWLYLFLTLFFYASSSASLSGLKNASLNKIDIWIIIVLNIIILIIICISHPRATCMHFSVITLLSVLLLLCLLHSKAKWLHPALCPTTIIFLHCKLGEITSSSVRSVQHLPLSVSPEFPRGKHSSYSSMSNEVKKAEWVRNCWSCYLMKVGCNRELCWDKKGPPSACWTCWCMLCHIVA